MITQNKLALIEVTSFTACIFLIGLITSELAIPEEPNSALDLTDCMQTIMYTESGEKIFSCPLKHYNMDF